MNQRDYFKYLITEGNLPDRLQILSMPAVNKTYCGTANFFPEIYWNKILCLQELGKDSCDVTTFYFTQKSIICKFFNLYKFNDM